ncbi:uncharacterized protein LOC100907060 [Galendromus occidentalis]|uniref:Uncharacterized protein LOC100907060 n=1 Tax=Galendromus occidentalis TaxID=34638 RepID=A0AAJ6QN10_9ACAR|nr:uncharacterized protein LOC100907060 [Galendromus occidentalis]
MHSEDKPFACEMCGKGCLTKRHLDAHVLIHEQRQQLHCQLCDRRFATNHNFRNHMKLHTGQKDFFCDICNAGFPIKARLTQHKRLHHSGEQYVCDICGKAFKARHILNDHKALRHSTEKSWVCEVCGAGFKLKSVLVRHLKTHSDERPYRCDICDKAFKDRSTLGVHRKTHSTDRPYLCEQCGMSFKRNAERKKHNCIGRMVHIPEDSSQSHHSQIPPLPLASNPPPQVLAQPQPTHHIIMGQRPIQLTNIMQHPVTLMSPATPSTSLQAQIMQFLDENLHAAGSQHPQPPNFPGHERMDDPKHDASSETSQFQPLSNMFNTIVLPPTNFESVYDQRDNDEVLSDIRQVKSELENSVLQSSLGSTETFESNPQKGVVILLPEAEDAGAGKISQDLASGPQILIQPSGVADEVQPVVESAVDSVVRSERLGDRIVTINVRDRNPGEADMEILPEEDLLDEFCRKHLTPARRLAQLAPQAEPLKEIVTCPILDIQLEESIKHNSRSTSEAQKQIAKTVLSTDGALRSLQVELRKLSVPVLDLVMTLKQQEKNVDWEPKVGDILCQLVLLNERIVSMRRDRILENLKKNCDLTQNLDMPSGEGDLFGSDFINEKTLIKPKKTKRQGTEAAPRVLKQKRTRKEPIYGEIKDSDVTVTEVEVDPSKNPEVLDARQDENNVGDLWNIEVEKSQRLKRTTRRPKPVADIDKEPAKEKTARLKLLRKEKREKEKAEREAEEAQIVADMSSGRKTRQSSKIDFTDKTAVSRITPELPEDIEENFDDDRDADYRAELDVEDDEEEEDEEEAEVALEGTKGSSAKYPVQGRRNDGNKESENSCEHCKYIADKRRKLIHHVKIYHPDKLIPCDLCDRKFAFQVSLWNHKNAMHLGAEFKCPQCTRSFKDAEKLRTHMFVHSSLKPFVCDFCGKGCLTKVHLDSHVKVHERRVKLYCQTCDRYFGSNHTFRNHMKLHSGEKEWFCDICNAGFPIKPRLVLHKKIAHSDEQYMCDECGKGFKMKHILNDHKALLHSSKKSFVCEICGVGFKLRSVLKRHMKTHSDERPHKCDLCDKAFKVKSTLVEHRKTHTNEKPYLCDQCGMAFKRNAERRKHNCVNKSDQDLSATDQVAGVADMSNAAGVEQQVEQSQQLPGQQIQMSLTSHMQQQLQTPPTPQPQPQSMAVHAQPIAVTTGHIVTHMPIQIAPQMIQLMPHSATLVTTGPQLMQVHDEQLQAVATAQFTNFSVG